jgi:hypothetical protein
VALPRIRIEYGCHDSDRSRDVPASTLANHAPPSKPEATVPVPSDDKRRDVPASAPANLAVPPALEAAMAFASKQQQPPLAGAPTDRPSILDGPGHAGLRCSQIGVDRSQWRSLKQIHGQAKL